MRTHHTPGIRDELRTLCAVLRRTLAIRRGTPEDLATADMLVALIVDKRISHAAVALAIQDYSDRLGEYRGHVGRCMDVHRFGGTPARAPTWRDRAAEPDLTVVG